MSGFPTFRVDEAADQRKLGQEMVRAWQRDGIFQVERDAVLEERTESAMRAARAFFRLPLEQKTTCVNDLSYSGYIESGEELTAGLRDQPEIFTITPDFPHHHPRVRAGLPCHGPVPWPGETFRTAMQAYLEAVGALGERILHLIALGLDLKGPEADHLNRLTRDGWHHMRVLRFPPRTTTVERGIGSHTDYGLLVIAAQDEVGGLYVRPPLEGEQRPRNWRTGESSAGLAEHEPGWRYVTPVPKVVTVFPGDILQFLTNGTLLSTPHKVRLADRERFTLAYFHEPSFDARVQPLETDNRSDHADADAPAPAPAPARETLHYGRHFTDMFMRCYPDRATTRRITGEGRLSSLDAPRPAPPRPLTDVPAA
ncbi:2-oxoglutarate and iron-dependent oxygenase domain-containing protein [Streptomyces sp. NPDC048603]|uniref:2-oxoglutarate and iron-dependent oxygenase domain-containing protein n=1 Tax=Streptomyces sp. NPDC048603 TaxID=3365577 RepID=UPI00372225AB